MVTYSPIVHIFLLEKYIQEISHFEMFTEFRAKLQFKDSEYLRSFVVLPLMPLYWNYQIMQYGEKGQATSSYVNVWNIKA